MFRNFALALALVVVPNFATAEPLGNELHQSFAKTLSSFVNEKGLVNYAGLKASPGDLNSYLKQISEVTAQEIKDASPDERLAFWMNAYNALTLKVIIDNHPIQSSFLKSALWPKNSIKQIDDAWGKKVFKGHGKSYSLDDIEHNVIRKQFDEPRIHMALVCAAIACPLLRTEPYYADQLEEQLNDQSTKFVNNPKKFRVEQGTVHLSSIFKWYGKDFVNKFGGEGNKFSNWNMKKDYQAVIAFAEPLLNENSKKLLNSGKKTAAIVKYNWELNEQ